MNRLFTFVSIALLSTCTIAAQEENFINGHEYVDLGLSVKWAMNNIGAERPGDYGNYYAWGETETKSSYRDHNSTATGLELGDISGDSLYDAAVANWGGTWRLPTFLECKELIDNCEWTWTSQSGNKGYRVTSKINGESIFLPAAGRYNGSKLEHKGVTGYYVTSMPNADSTQHAAELLFYNEVVRPYWTARYYGMSVRPVSE